MAALIPFTDPSLRPVLTYQIAWNFAVGIAASFFGVHMIRELRMGFVLIALHGTIVAAVRLLAAPLWGRAVDRVGARPVVVACSFGIAFLPAMWIPIRSDFLWPLLLDIAASGVFWGGQGVAALALPLAVAPREGRSYFLAAFYTVGGMAFAAASLLAGALAVALPPHFRLAGADFVPFHVLLALSFLARLTAAGLATRIVEPGARPVETLLDAMRANLRQTARRAG